eukprot:TRINITY_DN26057_c0_g1_i1.p1 TRINITY_DN26057_c0_g1~~TRINITY_DN26057_c0_g1_i1.p1  ORF type:complete len:469 (+),score=68.76 TRINITY_DN26057_c0_g1_i1:79-1485(+)
MELAAGISQGTLPRVAVSSDSSAVGILGGHGYVEVRVLGRGSFGTTTLVKNRAGSLCAMKVVELRNLDEVKKKDAMNEATVMAALSHPYIVRYHESFTENNKLAIVMEYAEGGDLHQRACRAHDGGEIIPESSVLRWFTQVALGVKYLHSRRILHRDLKNQNVFLSKHGDARIGDFGIALSTDRISLSEKMILGTPQYLSPEVYREVRYSFSSDVWGLGCILYELTALKAPFQAEDNKALARKILRELPPEMPAPYSFELRTLCKDLLNVEFHRRPSCAEIVQRPIVRQMMSQMLSEEKANCNYDQQERTSRQSKRSNSNGSVSRGPSGASARAPGPKFACAEKREGAPASPAALGMAAGELRRAPPRAQSVAASAALPDAPVAMCDVSRRLEHRPSSRGCGPRRPGVGGTDLAMVAPRSSVLGQGSAALLGLRPSLQAAPGPAARCGQRLADASPSRPGGGTLLMGY